MTLKIFLLICLLSFPGFSSRTALFAQSKPGPAVRDALRDAMLAQFTAKSYRFEEIRINGGEGVQIVVTSKGSYVAPDRWRATVGMQQSSAEAEALIVGGVFYFKAPNGSWEEKAANPQRIQNEFTKIRQEVLIESLTRAKTDAVKLIGQNTLAGAPVYVYQFSYFPPGVSIRHNAKIWVGVDDGLPRKVEEEHSLTQAGLTMNFKVTTSYSDYNSDIKIERPL